MDQETRAEVDKLHGRISDLKERVVNLEAQQPHINAALVRIERSVDKFSADIKGDLRKVMWAVLLPLIAAFVAFVVGGGLKLPV